MHALEDVCVRVHASVPVSVCECECECVSACVSECECERVLTSPGGAAPSIHSVPLSVLRGHGCNGAAVIWWEWSPAGLDLAG